MITVLTPIYYNKVSNNYIILSEKKWNKDLAENLSKYFKNDNWIYINSKCEFTIEKIDKITPKIIFIPHWSYLIPESIFVKYECIVFHMTDLPYGRGGSPLQNLIVRKFKETKISAIKVEREIDAGDIYLKKQLSLDGSAEEIFFRASQVIYEMILEIIEKKLNSYPQTGEPYIFERRKEKMSDISELTSIDEIYDYIRMLDAEGYPNAFFENKYFKFEFFNAKQTDQTIIANVRIFKK